MHGRSLIERLNQATEFVRSRAKLMPKLGVTLGSGLSGFATRIEQAVHIPFAEIPHFTPPTVAGHGGHLILGSIKGVPIAALQGRIHYYEGHSAEHVVFPTQVLARLGIRSLLLTNAAGGLDPNQAPGDFLIINDQINLTGANPLRGKNDDELGPRFVDMTKPYDPELSGYLKAALEKIGHRFSEGVYCGVTGPSYETAAEIRYMGLIGGKAVGMSTVLECIAARHMGVRVAGLSCITNLGTGLSSSQVTHEEVQFVASKISKSFEQTLVDFISQVGAST